MSIVEMPTIGDNFNNPPGGILVYLLKEGKTGKSEGPEMKKLPHLRQLDG